MRLVVLELHIELDISVSIIIYFYLLTLVKRIRTKYIRVFEYSHIRIYLFVYSPNAYLCRKYLRPLLTK